MASANDPDLPPLGHRPNGAPIRVVVADDQFSHRRIMVQILKSAGFQVVAEATNGEEAVYYVNFHKPEMLFLDYHMPRKDGLETLKELHGTLPDLKIIMFTTETEKDKVAEILKLGAHDYIVKPIDRLVVLKKLEHLLRT